MSVMKPVQAGMFQAAAEGNRQMGEVAANAAALGICFIRGSGDARVLVAEDQALCTKSQIACTRGQPSGV